MSRHSPQPNPREEPDERPEDHTFSGELTFDFAASQLRDLVTSGVFDKNDLRAFAELQELFSPKGNALPKPISRIAFEQSLCAMSSFDFERITPFVSHLVRVGLLYETQRTESSANIIIPVIVLENAIAIANRVAQEKDLGRLDQTPEA